MGQLHVFGAGWRRNGRKAAMKPVIPPAILIAMAASISACGGPPAENQAAAGESNETAMATDNLTADPSNPFAQAEMQMNERMMSATGTDVGDNWVRKIIPHHQGAIDMSRIVLDQNPTADVAEMARMTIEKQQKDIADIEKHRKEGSPDRQSAELFRSSMMDMHQKMQAAGDANVSETFMRKMLEHHRGGVTMSDIALQNGVSGALRAQVQKTRDAQQKETQMVEAMLQGDSHQEAMAKVGATKAPAEPKATAKSSKAAPATPKSAAKTPAKADEHAGHDMNKM
jgi:uncharacterized protein (DUF305 family)